MEQKIEKSVEKKLNPLPNLIARVLGDIFTFGILYLINPSEGFAIVIFCLFGFPIGYLIGVLSYIFERLINKSHRNRYVFFILTIIFVPVFFLILRTIIL